MQLVQLHKPLTTFCDYSSKFNMLIWCNEGRIEQNKLLAHPAVHHLVVNSLNATWMAEYSVTVDRMQKKVITAERQWGGESKNPDSDREKSPLSAGVLWGQGERKKNVVLNPTIDPS